MFYKLLYTKCSLYLLASSLILCGCGDNNDSGSNASHESNKTAYSSNGSNNPICQDGEIVSDGQVIYICYNEQWIVKPEQSNAVCVNGETITDGTFNYTCINGQWVINENFVEQPSSSSSIKPKVKSSSSIKVRSSSSIETTSSSSTKNMQSSSSSALKQSFSYGELLDSRDNQKYKTITIGSQTWMAENLNYITKEGKSFCYNNKATNCTKYGRMYQRAAAMDSLLTGCGANLSCEIKEPFQGVCPDGWHLPSKKEWKTLYLNVGTMSNAAKILKATTGWADNGNGTDNYGFSILPGGYYNTNKKFMNLESTSYFWTSSKTTLYSHSADGTKADTSIYFELSCFGSSSEGTCFSTGSEQSDVGAYIRCIKGAAKSEVVANSSSSKETKLSSSSSSLTISMGSMKDSRDGNTYSTVQIGDQVWMAENLRYRADSSFCYDSPSNNCTPNKQYGRLYKWATAMGFSEAICGKPVQIKVCEEGYKYFEQPYNSEEFDKYCLIKAPHQGICPNGWHIPTQDEWSTLMRKITEGYKSTAKSIAAAVTWTVYEGDVQVSTKGTNTSGFNAYPAGVQEITCDSKHPTVPIFISGGENQAAVFWTTSTSKQAFRLFIYDFKLTTGDELGVFDWELAHINFVDGLHLSVRCIKD